MMPTIRGWLAAVLLAAPMAANAGVVYQFDFFDLSGVTSGSGAPFTISLTYDDYVTTTGMSALSAGSASTTLGYPVNFAGTNSIGWWGFDDDGLASISSNAFSFGPFFGSIDQLSAFLFRPTDPQTGYFTAPGTYSGSVSGNASSFFGGSARLTISSTTAVPEPATLVLLGLGLVGLALARRRVPG